MPTPTVSIHYRLPQAIRPRIHDGPIVVHRPSDNTTCVFWIRDYVMPGPRSAPTSYNYAYFLRDLVENFDYDNLRDEIQWQMNPSYQRLLRLNVQGLGVNSVEEMRPITCFVRTVDEWLSALVAMQSSRSTGIARLDLMELQNAHSTMASPPPNVHAAHFFIVRSPPDTNLD
ncbi:uncharacterized protein N7529_011690 [Penicillium soppii]|uniref:uncharacterized protein n=1 Tax=Penicillium soppii TaxID=69789 RepID=UPI002546BE13|nr:uncharacterized protein N7529_011690 [Penicillium soppii]KAJ5852305.1 hypothetical protein N7529_011690 [Penicillium soppii]